MNSYIPFQNAFFYKGRWTPCFDKKLLSTIVRIKEYRRWEGQLIPEAVLVECAETMKHDLGVEMSTDELKLRLNHLKERYRTFNEITSTHGVTWEHQHNVIVASEEVWKKIFLRNPFAGAYYYRDESEYHLLGSVFGLLDEESAGETELIIISDTVASRNQEKTKLIIVSPTDTDEVNSPLFPIKSSVSRKLFDEDDSIDRQSSNAAALHARGLEYKLENHPPFRPLPSKQNVPGASPGVSSTASCSPYPRSQKPSP